MTKGLTELISAGQGAEFFRRESKIEFQIQIKQPKAIDFLFAFGSYYNWIPFPRLNEANLATKKF